MSDTTFDSSGGLVADTNHFSCEFPGTEAAAHDAASASTVSGTGGDQINVNNTFPKGITIFGRWTEIDVGAGMVIAYIGE